MTESNTPAVRTEGVWKIFQQGAEEVQAIRDVSLTVERGEFTALAGPSGGTREGPEEIARTKFIGRVVSGVSPRDLKPMADEAKQSLGSGVVVFAAASEEGKGSVVVGVTADLTDRFNAVDLVKVASAALGGKGGGGRPDMAQAGGPEGEKATAAVDAVRQALAG